MCKMGQVSLLLIQPDKAPESIFTPPRIATHKVLGRPARRIELKTLPCVKLYHADIVLVILKYTLQLYFCKMYYSPEGTCAAHLSLVPRHPACF